MVDCTPSFCCRVVIQFLGCCLYNHAVLVWYRMRSYSCYCSPTNTLSNQPSQQPTTPHHIRTSAAEFKLNLDLTYGDKTPTSYYQTDWIEKITNFMFNLSFLILSSCLYIYFFLLLSKRQQNNNKME